MHWWLQRFSTENTFSMKLKYPRRRTGKWFWERVWNSLCSNHGYKPDCKLCNVGSWNHTTYNRGQWVIEVYFPNYWAKRYPNMSKHTFRSEEGVNKFKKKYNFFTLILYVLNIREKY
jgi:hypothetical protein